MVPILRFALVFATLCAGISARAEEPRIAAPHFLGAQSCKSTGCHGGGGLKGQTVIWEKKDAHSRSHAILANDRSKRMAEALGIVDATRSARCTVCHSPMEALPSERLAKNAPIDRGVSCESCHGPAEGYLLSHTRKDVSHEQRLAMGIRPASDFYERANICIACHHMVDPELTGKGGHPEMYFELDGQMAFEPPHWVDEGTWLGPRAWLTGQAAALRELSWKLGQGPDEKLAARWRALTWLLHKTEPGMNLPDSGTDFPTMQTAADRLARSASKQPWTAQGTEQLFRKYAALQEDFRDKKLTPEDLRRRGEVLLYALDRLWTALKTGSKLQSDNLDKALHILGLEAKRQEAFDPIKYAAALQQIEAALELLPKK